MHNHKCHIILFLLVVDSVFLSRKNLIFGGFLPLGKGYYMLKFPFKECCWCLCFCPISLQTVGVTIGLYTLVQMLLIEPCTTKCKFSSMSVPLL